MGRNELSRPGRNPNLEFASTKDLESVLKVVDTIIPLAEDSASMVLPHYLDPPEEIRSLAVHRGKYDDDGTLFDGAEITVKRARYDISPEVEETEKWTISNYRNTYSVKRVKVFEAEEPLFEDITALERQRSIVFQEKIAFTKVSKQECQDMIEIIDHSTLRND
jgi:hypothetical protein